MIEWLLPHVDNFVAAANFTTVVLMVILGSVATYMLISREYTHESDIRTILLGVAIEAYAWGLHRLYWGTWRTLRAWGYDDWNVWFVNHSFLSLIPASLVMLGLGFILAPLWGYFSGGHIPGRKYYVIPAAFMVAVWWFFFVFITAYDRVPASPKTPKPATVFELDKREVNEDRSLRNLKE